MKRSPVLFALALAAAPALHAQEPAPANPARLQLAPAAAPSTPAPDGGPEVTLIPEQVPQNAKPTATPKPKPEVKDKTEESAEELLERIHFREAMTKALRDPQVQAEWDHSKKVKTDYDRRESLKRYYNLLYDRILKIDASVKKTSDLRQAAALHQLEQTRIDPTQPPKRQ
jgi:hypothetical protein